MERDLEKIITELNEQGSKIKYFLDLVEPILMKDQYQIEDIDYLKKIDFQVVRLEQFYPILMPILETNDEGYLVEITLIKNILNASILKSKKRYDSIFEVKKYLFDEKINEYKTRFFELGYCIGFIDKFINDFKGQGLMLELLFAYFAGDSSLFDFNELVKTANNEADLGKRKILYTSEYDRVNLLWLRYESSYKSSVDEVMVANDDCEPYNEENDEEFQTIKSSYLGFMDACKKAAESISYQIEQSNTQQQNNSKAENKKAKSSILEEKRQIREIEDDPEYQKAMENIDKNRFIKLTQEHIESVTLDCKAFDEVFQKGLTIFESYFTNNEISNEDVIYLQEKPFSGLLSDNYFDAMVLSNFDDPLVIGSIFDNCFADTIYKIHNLEYTFCSTKKIENEPRIKELIRKAIKYNNHSILIKDNLISFAKQIRELIKMVYSQTANDNYITGINIDILKNYNNYINIESFFDENVESKNTRHSNSDSANNELPENYINNGGIITTGSYDISEFYRYFSNKNTKKELFLVDKLEISLAHYASNYRKNCDDYWETYKFDPNYFNDFIPDTLLSEFNMALHEHIKPLNSQEINRFLFTSLQQFKTHTPDKRKDSFCEIYHDVYWYPNYMKYSESTSRENYVLHVWNLFSEYFHLFQEATQNAFDIFKASLTIGSANNIPTADNDNYKIGSKSEILKQNLYENAFFEITKVNSLSEDCQAKLVNLFVLNDIPYVVAMLDFLGYFKHLTQEHGYTNTKIHSKLSAWLGVDEQTVKCNMLVLNERSKLRENYRYTAHKHKEKVKTDYQLLK